jgi:ubiquinone/menaquinone biosynthesis C-methylase UbiE
MDHFQRIYTTQAARYHRMISAEDADGNLLSTLRAIANFDGSVVVDVGSGTGRLPLLLSPFTQNIWALDIHRHMLREQAVQREREGGRWLLCCGDGRNLPFSDACADIVTAGWVLGHFTGWYAASWRDEIGRALDEMARVLKPGGHLIVIETLSTGASSPAPPTPALAEYYAWLADMGMSCSAIATDYVFGDADEASDTLGFFFGPAMRDRIARLRWSRVPEWTGVWSRRQ